MNELNFCYYFTWCYFYFPKSYAFPFSVHLAIYFTYILFNYMSFVSEEQKYVKPNPERKDGAVTIIISMVIYQTVRNRTQSTILPNWDHDKNIKD